LVVSVGANILRALLGFAVGLLIARGLNPAGYGDLMFLLGSFVAIRSLLDLGSSSAFFTFLSQSARGIRFYLIYFSWLAAQFFVTLALLWLIIPSGIFEKIWLGHDREIVMLAFVAAFLQQQVWQMVGQIGEAKRKTVKVQTMNLAVALSYFVVIALISIYGNLSVEIVLRILIGLYVVATVVAYLYLRDRNAMSPVEESPLIKIFGDYWKYCKPLVVLALVSFAYDFADKWMLQRFGGATEQGYFQIANQFAAVSLLATTSILNIFWKEIADAWERQDRVRVETLYRKVSRGLVMLGAIISGLLLPWSEQIVSVFLGEAYITAWPVLAVMLLYPIHQSMGQIGGTMFLASGQTQKYMVIGIAMMLVSIPVSYFVLAPAADHWLPGLEMGALGVACKMVVLGIVSVNIQAWVIARYGGWKFDWVYQVVGIPMMIAAGFIAKTLSVWMLNVEGVGMAGLVVPVTIASVFYICFVITIIGWLPWLIGTDRVSIANLFGRALVGRR
jgi:O-antigen/teichoic acid export membrane protein